MQFINSAVCASTSTLVYLKFAAGDLLHSCSMLNTTVCCENLGGGVDLHFLHILYVCQNWFDL